MKLYKKASRLLICLLIVIPFVMQGTSQLANAGDELPSNESTETYQDSFQGETEGVALEPSSGDGRAIDDESTAVFSPDETEQNEEDVNNSSEATETTTHIENTSVDPAVNDEEESLKPSDNTSKEIENTTTASEQDHIKEETEAAVDKADASDETTSAEIVSQNDNEVTSAAAQEKTAADLKNKKVKTADDATSSEPHFDITWLGGTNTAISSSGKKAYATELDKNDIILATPVDDANSTRDSNGSTVGEKYYLSSQIHFSMGRSGYPIAAEDIKIVIPRYIFTEWNWNEEEWYWEGGKPVAPAGELHKPGDPNIGITKKPSTNDKGFYWYYSNEDGSEGTDDSEYITITNSKSIADLGNAPIDFTCMINYPYHPGKVNENIPVNIKAKIDIKNYENIAIENDTLTGSISTGTELTSVSKNTYGTEHFTEWDYRWGTPSNSDYLEKDKYRFVIYHISAIVSGEMNAGGSRNKVTQPFVLALADKNGEVIPDGTDGRGVGEVVARYKNWVQGYYGSGPNYSINFNNFTTEALTESVGQVIYPKSATGSEDTIYNHFERGCLPGDDYLFGSVEYAYTYVICAYKNEDFPAGEYVTNHVTVTKLPYSTTDDVEYKDAYKKETWNDIEFNYDGDKGGYYKHNAHSGGVNYNYDWKREDVEAAKYLLEHDKEAYLDGFNLGSYELRGFGLTQEGVSDYGEMSNLNGRYYHTITYSSDPNDYYKHPYTTEFMDTQLFLQDELLNDEDYDIVGTYYRGYTESFMDLETFKVGTRLKPDGIPEQTNKVYYRTDISEDWILLDSDVGKDTVVDGFPENAVQVKWAFDTYAYSIGADIYVNIKLNPTEHVKSLIKDIDKPQVTNIASFATKDYLGRIWDDTPRSTIDNTTSLSDQVAAHDENGNNGLAEGRYFVHDWAIQYLTDLEPETTFTKSYFINKEDRANNLTYVGYSLKLNQDFSVHSIEPEKTQAVIDEAGLDYGVIGKDFVFYDLLPEGVILDKEKGRPASVYFAQPGYSSSTVQGEIVSFKEIPNYKGSNRTLVVATCRLPEDFNDESKFIRYLENTEELYLSSEVRLVLNTVFSWEKMNMFGETGLSPAVKLQINYAAASWPGSGDGANDDCEERKNSKADLLPDDIKDVMTGLRENDSIEQAEGYDIYYDKVSTALNIASSSFTGYTKTIKSSIESTYRINSAEVHDGQYSYQLRFAMQDGSQAKDIIIYDVLEDAQIDTGYMEVGDHAGKYALYDPPRYWRGTFDHVDTSFAEALGAKVDVYYSTKPRDEMQRGLDNNYTGTADSAKYADLTNTTYWSMEMPEDKASITAVAFDVRKDQEGNDFIMEKTSESNPVLLLYIYMNAPDAEEILNGRSEPKHQLPDGSYDTEASEGSYMDPYFVYAYNNSFLSLRTKSTASDVWGNTGARRSDGTTIRLAEPTPPIYKQVEDKTGEQKAGKVISDGDKEISQNRIYLDNIQDEFKYTVSSRIPVLGIDSTSQDRQSIYTLSDNLENILDFVDKNKFKIIIGNENSDAYFIFDPEGSFVDNEGRTHKGYMKVWHGEYNPENPTQRIYEEEYFDNLDSLPSGIKFSAYNSTSTYWSFALEYPGASYGYGSTSDAEYDRVADFAGEEIYVEFDAKIVNGSALGQYTDNAVPNKARYYLDYGVSEQSNVVYVTPPDEETEKPKKKISVVDDEGNLVEKEQSFFLMVRNDDGTFTHKLDENDKKIEVTISNNDDGTITVYDKDDNIISLADNEEIMTRQQLDDVARTIHYSIDGKIPRNASEYTITDDVEKVLSIDPDSVTVTISGEAELADGSTKEVSRVFSATDLNLLAGYSTPFLSYKATSSRISLTLPNSFLNENGDILLYSTIEANRITPTGGTSSPSWYAHYNKYDFGLVGLNVKIDFDAKIKEGADLSAYINDESTVEIPNTAKYKFNNKKSEYTNPVSVTTETIETAVKIIKKWDDNDNAEGDRLAVDALAEKIRLLADGKEIDFLNDEQLEVTKTDNNDGSYTIVINNLPKFNEDTEIKYTVTEDDIEGYELVSNEDKAEADGEFAAEPELTNKHIPVVIDIEGTKTWDDDNDSEGLRPESIMVNLLRNGDKIDTATVSADAEGNWTYAFTGLDKYDEEGNVIEYSIEEEAVAGYTTTIDGFNITNKHTPEGPEEETVDIKVIKVWDDDNNKEGIRPDSVVIRLYVDGEPTENTVELSEENGWAGEFKDLPDTAEYTVEEDDISDYVFDVTGNVTEGFVVTNTYSPDELIKSVPVVKYWDDDDNRLSKRPESVVIWLYENGEKTDQSVELTAENGWSGEFYDLNSKADYTLVEDEVPDYKAEVTGNVKDGFKVTNKYSPKTRVKKEKESKEENTTPADKTTTTKSTTTKKSVTTKSTTTKKSPRTGDDNNLWIYCILIVGASACITLLLRRRSRR